LLVWRVRGAAVRLGSAELFLLIYAGLCAAQVPGSPNPLWSLWAWSWSVPGYLLFLMAGRATSYELFYADKLPVWAFLGFTGISLALVATGLVTGRVDQLFHTRNLGSIYASTAMLMFVALFVGPCWRLVRHSLAWSFTFLLVSTVCMVVSLSRTAIGALAMYAATMFTGSWAQIRRGALASVFVLASLAGAFLLVQERLDLDYQLLDAWSERWRGGDYSQAYGDARYWRESKFAPFRRQIWHTEPWRGHGFGVFRYFSEYTDAHDLLVTEAFENSLLATLFLVLSYSLPIVIRALFIAELRGLALSVLGFIVLGQLTGAMLSYRAEGCYYTPYPGWVLFYLVGFISGQLRLRGQDCAVLRTPARLLPGTDEAAALVGGAS